MQSLLRRTLGVGATTLLLSATLVGCSGGGGEGGSTEGGPVRIDLWSRAGDTSIEAEMKAYNESQDAIQVTVTPVDNEQYLQKLAVAVRSGDVPDIVDFDIINAPLLATQGILADITDQARELENFDRLVPGAIEVGTLDDRIYSLPVAMVDSGMFWNKDLFERAGLDPEKAPTSLAEVKEAAEKIQALGDGVYGFSTIGGVGQAYTGYPSIWADGGSIFTEAGPDQKATWNTEEVKGVVSWYADMWESGLMPPTDEPNQDPGNIGLQTVQEGKVGVIFTGADVFAKVRDQFGAAPGIPGVKGEGLSAFVGGNQGGVTAGSDNPEEAWEVLKWMVTDRAAAEALIEAGFIAPDLSLAEEQAQGNEFLLAGVEAFNTGQLPVSIAYQAIVNDANGPWAQGSRSVIFDGGDVDTAMAEAEAEANRLITDAYAQIG